MGPGTWLVQYWQKLHTFLIEWLRKLLLCTYFSPKIISVGLSLRLQSFKCRYLFFLIILNKWACSNPLNSLYLHMQSKLDALKYHTLPFSNRKVIFHKFYVKTENFRLMMSWVLFNTLLQDTSCFCSYVSFETSGRQLSKFH